MQTWDPRLDIDMVHSIADGSKQPSWAGLGISLGAGVGLVVGLLGWGGTGIALGAAFGACAGLVIGAVADSVKST